MKKFLVTGSAGFIGFHLCQNLLEQGHEVVGLDSFNDYYDVKLKEARNAILEKQPKFKLFREHLENKRFLLDLVANQPFSAVFHLAAQAGVRYSLDNPEAYLRANVDGTLNILEAARFAAQKPHLLMASSSSVYGLSTRLPFSEDDPADRPVALYGATKRADELMAHSYSHLFGLKVTMLRLFTVYGPWGRPDMALFKFVRAITEGRPIQLFNGGDMTRDFTYVDDVVQGMLGLYRAGDMLPAYDVFNIGCGSPRPLKDYVSAIEKALGRKAQIEELPFQAGDVHRTEADLSKLRRLTGYAPRTQIEEGVAQFVAWFQQYHGRA